MSKEQWPSKENIFDDPKVKETHERLRSVLRAGWVKRGVKNPENVYEHTEGMVVLLEKWQKDLGIKDFDASSTMLRVHDWPEILHGDELTYHLDGDEYKLAIDKKHGNEYRAMKQLCAPLGKTGETLLNLWIKFEEQKDYDSQIGYQIDKMHAVVKALEYEKAGEPVSTMEFVNEVRKRNQIIHPFLVKELEKIEEETKNIRNV